MSDQEETTVYSVAMEEHFLTQKDANMPYEPRSARTSSPKDTINNDNLSHASKSSWLKAYDKSGNQYFYDEITGHSQWEVPDGYSPSKIANYQYGSMVSLLSTQDAMEHHQSRIIQNSTDISNNFENNNNNNNNNSSNNDYGNRMNSNQDYNEWQETMDHESGSVYYWNTATGESRWDAPSPLKNNNKENNDNTNNYNFSTSKRSQLRDVMTSQFANTNSPADMQELLQSEEERLEKKFDKMKLYGRVLEEVGGWQQFESDQGAIFYAQIGHAGGQWKTPNVFKVTEAKFNNNNNNKGNNIQSPSNSIKYSSPPSREKSSSKKTPRPPLTPNPYLTGGTGIDRSNHSTPFAISPSPVRYATTGTINRTMNTTMNTTMMNDTDDEGFPKEWPQLTYTQASEFKNGQVDTRDEYGGDWGAIGMNGEILRENVDVDDVNGQDPGTRQRGEETKMGMTGDPRKLMRNRVKQSAAQQHFKGMYGSMRKAERAADAAVDVDELERRVDKARGRWMRFMGNLDAEEAGAMDHANERDNLATGHSNISEQTKKKSEDNHFNSMYSRAVVVRQQWPWTMLVDLKTDKSFYRNEKDEYFQVDCPAEMLVTIEQNDEDDEDLITDQEESAFRSEKIERDHREKVLSRKAMILAERYKTELKERQEFVERMKRQPKKIVATFEALEGATVRYPGDPNAEKQSEVKPGESSTQRRDRSVFSKPPEDFINHEKERRREMNVRKGGHTFTTLDIGTGEMVPMDLDVDGEPIKRTTYFSGATLGLEDDRRWYEALTFLDRLRRMSAVPKGNDNNTFQKRGKKGRKGKLGDDTSHDGTYNSNTQNLDDSLASLNMSIHNPDTRSHELFNNTRNVTFSNVSAANILREHGGFDRDPHDIEADVLAGGGGAGGSKEEEKIMNDPINPFAPRSTSALRVANQNAALGGAPTPVIVVNKGGDDKTDNGSIGNANEETVAFGESDNDNDEGNEANGAANGASQSLRHSWDKPSQLFDMFDMTDDERKEAEKIYRLRRQHEASVAFSCGSGNVSPPRDAPIIASKMNTVGLKSIPRQHAKIAYKIEDDYHRARRNIALRQLLVNAGQRRLSSYTLTQQALHIRETLNEINELVDAADGSWLQNEIRYRYLLEGAVLMKTRSTRMPSIRTASAYPDIPAHVFRPNNLRVHDLNSPMCPLGFTGKSLDGWNIYKENHAASNASKLPKGGTRSDKVFYVRQRDGRVQSGAPFDIAMKEKVYNDPEYLKAEKLSQYDWKPPRHIKLLSDVHDGIIFYCPRRCIFSSSEKLDIGFYESTNIPPKKLRDACAAIDPDLPLKTRNLGASNSTLDIRKDSRLSGLLKFNRKLPEPMFNVWDPEVTPLRKHHPEEDPETPRDERERWNVIQSAGVTDSVEGFKNILECAEAQMNLPAESKSVRSSISGPLLSETTVGITQKTAQNLTLDTSATTLNGTIALNQSMNLTGAGASNAGLNRKSSLMMSMANGLSKMSSLNDGPRSPQEADKLRKMQFATVFQIPEQTTQEEISDGRALRFECEMEADDYAEYRNMILEIYRKPKDIVANLWLARFLMATHHGKECLVVLGRVIECLGHSSNKITPQDAALLRLLVAKLTAKCLAEYRRLDLICESVNSCPDSSKVLSSAARCLHKVCLTDLAEQFYAGSLLIDPLCPDGLHGYAMLLVERGNLTVALRYLSRIDSSYRAYPMARLEIGWILELLGKHHANAQARIDESMKSGVSIEAELTATEAAAWKAVSSMTGPGGLVNKTRAVASSEGAIVHAFQAVLGLGQRDLATSQALTGLGHFYHVRGDVGRAIDYYHRALVYDKNDPVALALLSSLCATTIVVPYPGVPKASLSVDEIDSNLRRGIFLLHGGCKWISLLITAQFVCFHLGDMHRTEALLWDAARRSIDVSIWSAIALVHFYQYTIGDLSNALRVLMWARSRRISQSRLGKESKSTHAENLTMTATDESRVIIIVEAYHNLDVGNLERAHTLIEEIIMSDTGISAAHRLNSILAWLNDSRMEAMAHAQRALNAAVEAVGLVSDTYIEGDRTEFTALCRSNSFTLRYCSVLFALHGRYQRALLLMDAAVQSNPGNSLSWRYLGIMSYYYNGDLERAQACLQQAAVLCKEDYIALRMRGQVLLELGRPKDARKCLQDALELVPGDALTMGSLALCVRAMGYKPPSGIHRLNYKLVLQNVVDLRVMINCTDCEELFEASSSSTFSDEVRNRAIKIAGREEEYSHSKEEEMTHSKPIVKGAVEETAVDVPPDALYWCGMYWLQMGRPENLLKAEEMFKRATQRVDIPAHAISIYMLGWLAELKGDLRAAERFYCFSLQLEPCEPLMFLKVAKIAEDTCSYVKGLSKACSKRDRLRRKAERKKQKQLAAGKLVAKGDRYGYSFPPKGEVTEDAEADFTGGMSKSAGSSESMSNLPKTSSMRDRMLLHDRVIRLATLRRTQLKNSLVGLHVPGKFVHLEPFWLEKAVHAFSECDDWAVMLRSTREFRATNKIRGTGGDK